MFLQITMHSTPKKETTHAPHTHRRLALSAAGAAVGVSVFLVFAKSWAWMAGGSAAILSSLVDSVIDALISLTNMAAIWYAHKPADHDHRYGHGKIEGVAALVQAAFIGGASVFVVLEALRKLTDPTPVTAQELSIGILLLATCVTLALTAYQKYAAAKSHSLAVEADKAHYSSDIVVHIGVIITLLLEKYTGWLWLDPVVALLITAWLLRTAIIIGRQAVNMLLDRELDDDVRTHMRGIIMQDADVLGVHDLRTRRSGHRLFISFDIEVSDTHSFIAAHDISRRVEASLMAAYPRAEIMIHIDPQGDVTDSRHQKLQDFHAI